MLYVSLLMLASRKIERDGRFRIPPLPYNSSLSMSATPSSLSSRPQELTPQQLATLWKKTGQFDKLRKQFLQDFLNSVRSLSFPHCTQLYKADTDVVRTVGQGDFDERIGCNPSFSHFRCCSTSRQDPSKRPTDPPHDCTRQIKHSLTEPRQSQDEVE